MYENLKLGLDLKLLFVVAGACYESGLRKGWVKIQQMYENLGLDLDMKLLFMVTGAYYESGLRKGWVKIQQMYENLDKFDGSGDGRNGRFPFSSSISPSVELPSLISS